MNELAFNANGDSFDVPATVSAWRVRRMKPRGAPELVYGRDGRPLTVPIETDIDELREAVGQAGKYRLDPINDDGKCVENVPPAYVQVVKPERAETAAALVTSGSGIEDLLRDAMKHNAELSMCLIGRFPEIMSGTAELLRAADGAGLPARKPREIEVDDDDDDDDEESIVVPNTPGIDLNALIAQIVPMVIGAFMSGKMKIPGLGAIFDWRKAKPAVDDAPAQTAKLAASTATAPASSAETEVPPIDPVAMAHVIAIQSALKPEEVAFVQEVAKELSPSELRGWFDKLSKLSVPAAVEVIRGLIAGKDTKGGAS
jgi:hypothetical protein